MSDNINDQSFSFLPRLRSQPALLAHLRSLPPSTFNLQPLYEQEIRIAYRGEFEVDSDEEEVDENTAARRRFVEAVIRRLEEEQNSRPCPPMSRACAKCRIVPEGHRKVFACGHATCHSCDVGRTSCPACEKEGQSVRLFEDEEENGSHVITRACWNCDKVPHRRAVYTNCGHIICRVCAEKWELATPTPSCPHCKTEGGFVALVEEQL